MWMGKPFHTWGIPDPKSQILLHPKIRLAVPCAMQTCIAFSSKFLTLSSLATLGTPDPLHHWSSLGVLLNCLIYKFRYVRVHHFGSLPVHVELVYMIYGGVSVFPELQRIVYPARCYCCGIFIHTHTYVLNLPPDIIWSFWTEHWYLFLVYPGSWIWYMFHFSAWVHDCHWRLLPWIFVSFRVHFYHILLQWLCYHGFVFFDLKSYTQALHFYWEYSSRHFHKRPGVVEDTHCLKFCFDCSVIFISLHCRIFYQQKLLVALMVGFYGKSCRDLNSFWHQELLNINTWKIRRLLQHPAETYFPLEVYQYWTVNVCKNNLLTGRA